MRMPACAEDRNSVSVNKVEISIFIPNLPEWGVNYRALLLQGAGEAKYIFLVGDIYVVNNLMHIYV
jgi:hypothetical protein